MVSVIKEILNLKIENQRKISEYYDKEIVGFSVLGDPISRVSLKKELENVKVEIKNGKVINQEDLEKESKNW